MQLTHKAGLALASLTLLGLAASSPAHASDPNLVTNPGFESGNFTGWTTTLAASGSDVYVQSDPGAAHSGSYEARFGGTSSTANDDDRISQSLTTTAGQTYDISFWLKNIGGPSNDFHAAFGGTSLLNITDASSFDYTQYNFTEKATGPTTLLEFSGRQVPAYFYLDDISVTAGSPVPEASTLVSTGLLLCLGLGGLAVSVRRRKGLSAK